jgi:hypothetical protein
LKRFPWPVALFLQAAAALAVSYAACQLFWFGAAAYAVGIWVVVPAFGAASAYYVTVMGLSNYAAWLMPPLTAVAGHYLAFFYPPESAGPAFLCALLSVIGAAAGEVVKRRHGE